MAFCGLASAEDFTAVPKLRIEASVEGASKEDMQVSFRVINISKEPVKIYNISTPWGARVNTIVAAVTKKSQRPLNGAGYAPETFFPLVEHVVQPGEFLSGSLPLTELIDQVSLRRSKEDIVFFWHYTAKGTRGEPLGEYGGWLSVR